MIITRTPLRISIGGGGTDLPSYCERFGGFVISAAINKYVYISANTMFQPGYLVKYSKTEHVDTYDDIEHDLIREVLRHMDVEPHLEIVSIADVPAGTGLGSSGSFTVGLIHALNAYRRQHIGAEDMIRVACDIEMSVLGQPCGKQDQYIAAYGGMLCQEYRLDGSVTVSPLKINEATLRDLSENLMLFFTGYSRSASDVLEDQKARSQEDDKEMLNNLHFIKELGLKIREALEEGDTSGFAELMHEHWMHKKVRSAMITNRRINDLYDHAREHGALGGKLVGAGGGGFLLFYTHDRRRLRKAMADEGLQEMDFSFDFDGSVVLLRN
jgi:D-glycero-alpha-D-manno-heptose-7-phosphate kinase